MFLLIDNYDSFTYNLAQAFQALGKNPLVLKNDDPAILDLAKSRISKWSAFRQVPGIRQMPAFVRNFSSLSIPKCLFLAFASATSCWGFLGAQRLMSAQR